MELIALFVIFSFGHNFKCHGWPGFLSLVMRHTGKAFGAQKDDSARGLCAKVPQAEDAGLEALRDTECSEARDRRG